MKKWFFPALSAGLFGADQIMKQYAEENLAAGEEVFLTEKVSFRKVHNKGMCLGIMKDKPETVRKVSVGVTAVLTFLQAALIFRKGKLPEKLGISLLASGAWSNTMDRLLRGYVVDYIGIKGNNEAISKVTYNAGDISIGVGAAIIVLCALFRRDGKRSTSNKVGRGRAEKCRKVSKTDEKRN